MGTEVPREEFRPVLDALEELLQLLKGGALPPKDPLKVPVDPGPIPLDRGNAGLPRGEATVAPGLIPLNPGNTKLPVEEVLRVGNLERGPSLGDDWHPAGVMERGGVYFKPEENRVWLRLELEFLGGIQGEIELEHDRIKAHFFAESRMAKEALEGNLAQLKEALRDQGLRLDSFSVTVEPDGRHYLSDGLFSFRHPGGNGDPWQQRADQRETWERPRATRAPADRIDRSQVDLFV